MTLPEGPIGFYFLDVADKEELKYQIRNPYELTNAIITTDDKYNDCFLLHSLIPAQSPDICLQIIHGTENRELNITATTLHWTLHLSRCYDEQKIRRSSLTTNSWTSRCM